MYKTRIAKIPQSDRLCVVRRTSPSSHAGASGAPLRCGMAVMRMSLTTWIGLGSLSSVQGRREPSSLNLLDLRTTQNGRAGTWCVKHKACRVSECESAWHKTSDIQYIYDITHHIFVSDIQAINEIGLQLSWIAAEAMNATCESTVQLVTDGS